MNNFDSVFVCALLGGVTEIKIGQYASQVIRKLKIFHEFYKILSAIDDFVKTINETFEDANMAPASSHVFNLASYGLYPS